MKIREIAVTILAAGVAMTFACTGGGETDGGTTSSSSSSGGAVDCGTRPANHTEDDSSTLTKAAVDAVIGTNTLTSGTAFAAAKYCGNADGHAYWWKLSGAHASGAAFRLQVAFDRGADANDVDFDVVYFDADGAGYTNVASCSAASGTNEDCNGTLSEATTDIYVKTDTSTSSTNEGFSITLTKS